MADYIIDGAILTDIADAVRAKTGKTEPIAPENMASVLLNTEGDYERGYAEGYMDGNYLPATVDKTVTAVNDDRLSKVPGSFFQNCKQLTSVNLPNVLEIGNSAFQYCDLSQEFNMPKVQKIGTSAFTNTKLTEAVFPECTEMGDSVFTDAGRITRAHFPKLLILSSGVFNRTVGLVRAEFDVLEEIKGSYAFNGDRALSKLIIRTPKVCVLGNSTFANTNASVLRIYVPDDLVDQYKAATNWSALADQIKPISELEG